MPGEGDGAIVCLGTHPEGLAGPTYRPASFIWPISRLPAAKCRTVGRKHNEARVLQRGFDDDLRLGLVW